MDNSNYREQREEQMRLIRVKEKNAPAIITEMKNLGISAQVVDSSLMPIPERWCYRSYPGENWVEELEDLAEMTRGMVPLEISCSANRANKIIQSLKAVGKCS